MKSVLSHHYGAYVGKCWSSASGKSHLYIHNQSCVSACGSIGNQGFPAELQAAAESRARRHLFHLLPEPQLHWQKAALVPSEHWHPQPRWGQAVHTHARTWPWLAALLQRAKKCTQNGATLRVPCCPIVLEGKRRTQGTGTWSKHSGWQGGKAHGWLQPSDSTHCFPRHLCTAYSARQEEREQQIQLGLGQGLTPWAPRGEEPDWQSLGKEATGEPLLGKGTHGNPCTEHGSSSQRAAQWSGNSEPDCRDSWAQRETQTHRHTHTDAHAHRWALTQTPMTEQSLSRHRHLMYRL